MTTTAEPGPRFSVVIATRNRSAELQRAVASVLAQRGTRFELIVVDDGSSEPVSLSAHLPANPSARPPAASGLTGWQVLPLRQRRQGHGPAFARNEGVSLARGDYLCFLDDDDLWTDPDHLARVDAELAAANDATDACYALQRAWHANGQPHPGPLWLDGLAERLKLPAGTAQAHPVSAADLLQADGFAHLNTSIYRAAFFRALGGFDESLRYEEDRDLYLRAIDQAGRLLFMPRVVARHHIPPPRQASTASTQLGDLDRHLMRLRWCDRLLASARQSAVQRHARLTKAYSLKHRAQALRAAGDPAGALRSLDEALACDFSFKWLLYTLWARVQSPSTRRPEST